jgi:hypothetical protein
MSDSRRKALKMMQIRRNRDRSLLRRPFALIITLLLIFGFLSAPCCILLGLFLLSLAVALFLCLLFPQFALFFFFPPGLFASFLLLALLPLRFGLSLSFLTLPSKLFGLLPRTLLFLGLPFCFFLLPLLLPFLSLFLEFLLLFRFGSCFLCSLLRFPARAFLFLGLFLKSLLVLPFLCFPGFFSIPLFVPSLLFHEFFDQLLLPLLGDLFSVCRQDALLEHSGRKYLKHSSAFFHALFFCHGILK